MPKKQCTPSERSSQPSSSSVSTPPAELLGLEIGGQQAAEDTQPVETIPEEETGDVKTLAKGEDVAELNLSRGQYRASFTVPAETNPKSVEGRTERVRVEGEMKRVHFYKVDAVPLDEETEEGKNLTKVTAVFRVIDNPLPLAPIAWGAAALVGVGGGSWLLFDSAESFVEETQWPILTGAAAILSVFVGWHTLFG